jgi:protein-tyrosine phosphatase
VKEPIRVLFVCLGNICRSPTAHAIFEKKIIDEGLQHKIIVDSAGTGDWHIGRAPDPRACLAASVHGYDLTQLRARQVKPEDFNKFDYVVAMDKRNLLDLKIMAPPQFAGHLGLFLDHSRNENKEVPDPYAGGKEGFEDVLNLIEDASNGLLEHLSGQLT